MNTFNKIFSFLFLLISAGTNSSLAQSLPKSEGSKGQILIYGSLDYSKTSGPADKSSDFSTSPGAGIPVGVGYFITDNTLVGVNFAFSHKNDHNGHTAFQQQETGFWFSPSIPISKNIALIAQADVHYVWGKSPDINQNLQSYHGYRLRAYPMIGVALGRGWSLKFKFGELSLLSTKTKNEGRLNNYVAGLSGATMGTGISKSFSLGRKKHSLKH